MTHFESVCEFMTVMGQDVLTEPTLPTYKLGILRYNLIEEEVDELHEALISDNYVEIADALADILYVAYGAYAAFGLTPPTHRYAERCKAVERPAQLLTIDHAMSATENMNISLNRMMAGYVAGNLVEVRIALCDIINYAYRTAWLSGIDLFACFEEVHNSNMSKACLTLSDAKRSLQLRKEDPATAAKYEGVEPVQVGEYFVLKRTSDGKVLKGMHYFEPNLKQFLKL